MNRRYELDLMRICTCLMVVVLHTAATGWHIDPGFPEWRYYNLADQATRAGVPLFFMLSGTLFLDRPDLEVKDFLRRHAARLLLLYVFWSGFYALAGLYADGIRFSLPDFFLRTAAGHYHLQFLIIQFFLYLLLPILYCCLRGKKMGIAYPLFLSALIVLRENLALIPNPPNLLAVLLDKLSGSCLIYIGYIVLGGLLGRLACPKWTRAVCPVGFAAVTLLAAWANRQYSIQQGEPQEWLYGYLCLATVIQAVCIFCFFQSFRGLEIKHPKVLRELSACTLGVYLLHPFALERLREHGISVEMSIPLKSLPFMVVLVLALCLTAAFLLRRIPGVKKLIST